MIVAKISKELAIELKERVFNIAQRYNPVRDGNGNWIISEFEAKTLSEKEYELIEYVPIKEEE